ncbi:nucleotide pyrophosphohydrolase [Hylemonella gracilis]|uniref:Nucleotide pyrophosphohydrolase n=2 Tax=Hylemonella gracilis TaxID=80880 RepID=A0A4P6UHV2_9BURK|nr:nucleotide pyrophosphohydrolase [Hylemonella gracilis]
MNAMANPSRLIDVTALEAALQKFADERDWNQYHSPKNLAMALTGEVGELVEVFQWLTEEQSKAVAQDPKTARAVRDELADVALYLVRLSSVLGVDLNEAVVTKLKSNAQKYPVGDSTPKRTT